MSTGRQFQTREKLFVALVGVVLVGYILFLLLSNYRSQAGLRDFALERIQLEAASRALIVGHVYAERREDLTELADSRELDIFFTNKALKMSMQYGLRASLLKIRCVSSAISRSVQ